mmetsp:Transcript_9014/g.18900  ORF Transcript_9014/g.18900 Transcript_9014/m.18900 type:complete len:156 (-) Transcript_9014:157-624(-)
MLRDSGVQQKGPTLQRQTSPIQGENHGRGECWWIRLVVNGTIRRDRRMGKKKETSKIVPLTTPTTTCDDSMPGTRYTKDKRDNRFGPSSCSKVVVSEISKPRTARVGPFSIETTQTRRRTIKWPEMDGSDYLLCSFVVTIDAMRQRKFFVTKPEA